MALLDTNNTSKLSSAQFQELENLINQNNRTAFYVRLAELTGSQAALDMAEISQSSGIRGGTAWLLNKAYLETVPGYPAGGVEVFSEEIAINTLQSIKDSLDLSTGKYGVPSDLDIYKEAQATWKDVGTRNGHPELANLFPGAPIIFASYLQQGEFAKAYDSLTVATPVVGALDIFAGWFEGLSELYLDEYNNTNSINDFNRLYPNATVKLHTIGGKDVYEYIDGGKTVGIVRLDAAGYINATMDGIRSVAGDVVGYFNKVYRSSLPGLASTAVESFIASSVSGLIDANSINFLGDYTIQLYADGTKTYKFTEAGTETTVGTDGKVISWKAGLNNPDGTYWAGNNTTTSAIYQQYDDNNNLISKLTSSLQPNGEYIINQYAYSSTGTINTTTRLLTDNTQVTIATTQAGYQTIVHKTATGITDLVKTFDPTTSTTELMQYDAKGTLINNKATDTAGNIIHDIRYLPDGGTIVAGTGDSAGTTYYYRPDGSLTTRYADGSTSDMVHNGLGGNDVIKRNSDGTQSLLSYYDQNNNNVAASSYYNPDGVGSTITYRQDGSVEKVVAINEDGSIDVREFDYGNNLVSELHRNADGTSSQANYDSLGNIVTSRVDNGDGTLTEVTVYPDGSVKTKTFETDGKVSTQTTGLSNGTQYAILPTDSLNKQNPDESVRGCSRLVLNLSPLL